MRADLQKTVMVLIYVGRPSGRIKQALNDV